MAASCFFYRFHVKEIAILDPSTGSLDHRVRIRSSGMSIWSGQIIATESTTVFTPNGGLVREIRLFQGNLGWGNIIIWPDLIYMHFVMLPKSRQVSAFWSSKMCPFPLPQMDSDLWGVQLQQEPYELWWKDNCDEIKKNICIFHYAAWFIGIF